MLRELHEEHLELLEHVGAIRTLARDTPSLDADGRGRRLEHVLRFLRGRLMPHAQAEENGLYRGVASVLGDPRSIAPMLADHKHIREYVEQLDGLDVEDTARMQELLYGVYALIIAHFRKEEELYIPLVTR